MVLDWVCACDLFFCCSHEWSVQIFISSVLMSCICLVVDLEEDDDTEVATEQDEEVVEAVEFKCKLDVGLRFEVELWDVDGFGSSSQFDGWVILLSSQTYNWGMLPSGVLLCLCLISAMVLHLGRGPWPGASLTSLASVEHLLLTSGRLFVLRIVNNTVECLVGPLPDSSMRSRDGFIARGDFFSGSTITFG